MFFFEKSYKVLRWHLAFGPLEISLSAGKSYKVLHWDLAFGPLEIAVVILRLTLRGPVFTVKCTLPTPRQVIVLTK